MNLKEIELLGKKSVISKNNKEDNSGIWKLDFLNFGGQHDENFGLLKIGHNLFLP